jgi:glycine hydroxymethyltransferase
MTRPIAKKINSAVFPRPAGRTADARHRCQGGGVRRGARTRFKAIARRRRKTPRSLSSRLKERGADIVRAHRSHLALIDLSPLGVTGRDADEALERSSITCNKNGIPFDPLPPGQDQRHPCRIACRHDTRLRPGRVP